MKDLGTSSGTQLRQLTIILTPNSFTEIHPLLIRDMHIAFLFIWIGRQMQRTLRIFGMIIFLATSGFSFAFAKPPQNRDAVDPERFPLNSELVKSLAIRYFQYPIQKILRAITPATPHFSENLNGPLVTGFTAETPPLLRNRNDLAFRLIFATPTGRWMLERGEMNASRAVSPRS